MSAEASRARSRAGGASAPAPTLRLKQLRYSNRALTVPPPAAGTRGWAARIGSPPTGSILTTSAPSMPSRRPQYAPATLEPTSTTRSPKPMPAQLPGRSGPERPGSVGRGTGLGWWRAEARAGDGGLPPAAAADDRQLAHQRDGARVVVAGAGLDGAVGQHPVDDVATGVRADDGERPVVEGPDPSGRDIGVLGREVGARLAPLARPGVALLQRDLVVRAVLHPDLEDA